MIVSLWHLFGGSSTLFARARTSSSKTWLSVGNCSLCRRNGLALDNCPAQAVLGCVENVLVWVEEFSGLGYSPNRRELASSGDSFVLNMGLKIQTSRSTEVCRRCYSVLQSESNTVTKMSRKLRKMAASVKQMATNEGENGLREFAVHPKNFGEG
jgi:hypothetical protein